MCWSTSPQQGVTDHILILHPRWRDLYHVSSLCRRAVFSSSCLSPTKCTSASVSVVSADVAVTTGVLGEAGGGTLRQPRHTQTRPSATTLWIILRDMKVYDLTLEEVGETRFCDVVSTLVRTVSHVDMDASYALKIWMKESLMAHSARRLATLTLPRLMVPVFPRRCNKKTACNCAVAIKSGRPPHTQLWALMYQH